MKKKLTALLLCAAMSMTVAGCSSELSNEYITIKKYKGLEVTQVKKAEVSDDDVESSIERILAATPMREEITDRGVEMGDTINLDYAGSVDGVEFSGGSTQGNGTEIVVGQAKYIEAYGEYKGFEEQLVGHKTGEKFDIEVRFPADYYNTELADKVAVFNITLNGIYKVEPVTELSDEWVKKNSEESKTVAEYKKEVRKNLETSAENEQKSALQSGVMAALAEQIEVKKFPEGEVEAQYKQMEDYYKSAAEAAGVEFSEYLQNTFQMTEEDFEKQAQEISENAVENKLAVELIAKKKHLEPSEKVYEAKLKEYAEQFQVSVEDFKKTYDEETIRRTIMQEAVANYLVESCVQVEATEDTAENK